MKTAGSRDREKAGRKGIKTKSEERNFYCPSNEKLITYPALICIEKRKTRKN